MQNPNHLTGIPYLDEDDHAAGFEAIKLYHNHMVRLYPGKYEITLDTLIRELAKRPGQKFFLDGLGLGIQNVGMSEKQVNIAMENLAKDGKGRVPGSNSAFVQSLTNSSQVADWIDLPSFVVLETGKNLLGATKAIGQSIIDIGEDAIDTTKSLVENARYIVPVVIIVGVVASIYFYSRK